MFEIFFYQGRYTRTQFWFAAIIPLIAIGSYRDFLLYMLDDANGLPLAERFNTLLPVLGVSMLFMVPMICIFVAACTKRYHDLDRDGGVMLILFVPVIGQVWFFWMMIELGFFKGTDGPNQFDKGFVKDPASRFGPAGPDEDTMDLEAVDAAIARALAGRKQAALNSAPATGGGGFGKRGTAPGR